jgi:hypothetical protein
MKSGKMHGGTGSAFLYWLKMSREHSLGDKWEDNIKVRLEKQVLYK